METAIGVFSSRERAEDAVLQLLGDLLEASLHLQFSVLAMCALCLWLLRRGTLPFDLPPAIGAETSRTQSRRLPAEGV